MGKVSVSSAFTVLSGQSVRLTSFNAAMSRARPRMLRQSPRLGVSPISIMQSFRPRYWRMSVPIGASSGRISSPLADSAMPSSVAEQSIPKDSMPRNFARLIAVPLGSVAPMSAVGTRTPVRTLAAPQTMVSGSVVPTSTVVTLSLSACGCCSTEVTKPTTIC